MEIQEILKTLREQHHMTQEQLAERVMVTRQAVSRWETGETQPNTDTLKLLSREFDVSINTLLGSPRALVCQCCGMPLSEDSLLSREPGAGRQLQRGLLHVVLRGRALRLRDEGFPAGFPARPHAEPRKPAGRGAPPDLRRLSLRAQALEGIEQKS